MAQRALESNSKLKGNDSRNISAYFNKVPSLQPLGCDTAITHQDGQGNGSVVGVDASAHAVQGRSLL